MIKQLRKTAGVFTLYIAASCSRVGGNYSLKLDEVFEYSYEQKLLYIKDKTKYEDLACDICLFFSEKEAIYNEIFENFSPIFLENKHEFIEISLECSALILYSDFCCNSLNDFKKKLHYLLNDKINQFIFFYLVYLNSNSEKDIFTFFQKDPSRKNRFSDFFYNLYYQKLKSFVLLFLNDNVKFETLFDLYIQGKKKVPIIDFSDCYIKSKKSNSIPLKSNRISKTEETKPQTSRLGYGYESSDNNDLSFNLSLTRSVSTFSNKSEKRSQPIHRFERSNLCHPKKLLNISKTDIYKKMNSRKSKN